MSSHSTQNFVVFASRLARDLGGVDAELGPVEIPVPEDWFSWESEHEPDAGGSEHEWAITRLCFCSWRNLGSWPRGLVEAVAAALRD
jgi:hypothetical protein